jgi:hypothetical protein
MKLIRHIWSNFATNICWKIHSLGGGILAVVIWGKGKCKRESRNDKGLWETEINKGK